MEMTFPFLSCQQTLHVDFDVTTTDDASKGVSGLVQMGRNKGGIVSCRDEVITERAASLQLSG